ncbi:SHOCT domain-containing protein [Acetobacterium sp. UBA5834]|uniref:SHOCT domain-containing protein n=1 Tax=Acetobacterium sp. UBA5834 TaxID=1945907 RepID=UPI00257DE34C|nr:SHOCT domain-containing protein [Acetobacterium sp. UBA5834]
MMGFNTLGWHGIHSLYGMHNGFGMMGITGGVTMFMVLLLVLVVVVAIVWFSKNGNPQNNRFKYQTTDRSLEILNERYASGEIADEEYAKKKIELRKHNL